MHSVVACLALLEWVLVAVVIIFNDGMLRHSYKKKNNCVISEHLDYCVE